MVFPLVLISINHSYLNSSRSIFLQIITGDCFSRACKIGSAGN
jgi:hypothetical protein